MTNTNTKKIRALGLCSGGLDSILSALVLQKQGITVEWLTFETPFFSSEKAHKASQMTGIPLNIRNITPVYLEMLKNPRCGYGRNMNPCMDCHALMFRCAGEMMKENRFDFIFSGEVVGQRPMSQTKQSLRYVEKHSGYDGYILRPLSAKILPETIPEKEGLINRELLLDINGRGRKEQIELAEKLGIKDYPVPAGGCLLTDKNFSIRLKDLFKHQENYTENELHLLKYGRHFRIGDKVKIIVGRTKQDNENILKHYNSEKDLLFKVKNFPGPLVLIPGLMQENFLLMEEGVQGTISQIGASICTGYSKTPKETLTDVIMTTAKGSGVIQVNGMMPEKIQRFMI